MLKLWYLAAASLVVGILWQHGVASDGEIFEYNNSSTAGISQTDGTSQTGGISPTDGTSPTGGISPTDGTSPTDSTSQIGGNSPTDGTTMTSGNLRTDGTSQTDGNSQTDGTSQTGGISTTDGTTMTSGNLPTDGTSPTGGISPTDGTSPTDSTSQIGGNSRTDGTSPTDSISQTGGNLPTDGTSQTDDTLTGATTLVDGTSPTDRTTSQMSSTTTTPADRRTTQGRFTITDMDISEINPGFNQSVIDEIHSICAKNDEIGWCLVVWIMYLPGSVRVEFHLSVRETVTDQEFFDALEQAIENDEFLNEYTIDPGSLEFGDSGPKEEWTTTQIAVVAVLGGLCVIAIAISTVAIVLFTRRKKGLSTTDAADTSVTNLLMGSRRNSYESNRARASTESRPNQYEITDSLTSSHDSGMAVDRMVVIQGAMDKAPDIDWSAMKNFKMKNGGSSYENPIYDTGNEDETVFPAVQTTF